MSDNNTIANILVVRSIEHPYVDYGGQAKQNHQTNPSDLEEDVLGGDLNIAILVMIISSWLFVFSLALSSRQVDAAPQPSSPIRSA
jgi:hypothetical protein